MIKCYKMSKAAHTMCRVLIFYYICIVAENLWQT